MIERDMENERILLVGPQGYLSLHADDEITLRLGMLYEGECEGKRRSEAARKFGYTRQRYHQLLQKFTVEGAAGLKDQKRGPKGNDRRTDTVVRQIITYTFLDPEMSASVIAQKLKQCGYQISVRSIERVICEDGLQKKRHLRQATRERNTIETHRTKAKTRSEHCDPGSLEREVRQLLAKKLSGTRVGSWLLVPEDLRLGVWHILKSWSRRPEEQVATRLALQLVNEAALCVTGIRDKRTLSQKGFEVANGRPFVATAPASHGLLDAHRVAEAKRLQTVLGKIRQTFGHFTGRLLAIDPHRIQSYSKPQMVRRKKSKSASKPSKMAQTFFCLDPDTKQPLCFTTATAAKTVTQATPELLKVAADILSIRDERPLVLADNEQYTVELFDWVYSESPFDRLVPMPKYSSVQDAIKFVPDEAFNRQWAGYATAKQASHFKESRYAGSHQFIQRKGEREQDDDFKAFVCTHDRNEMEDRSIHYPERWPIEEFFHNDQALGWDRAGTMNLHIRYGKMSMALLAQAAIFMMRQRVGKPVADWDSKHIASDVFRGLEGDIRVQKDTIIVTYYPAPNPELMKRHYEHVPDRLMTEGITPHIPWLYDFKLDFRFK
jgi:hypothetical protein